MTAITSAVSSVFVCVFLMCMSVSFFVVYVFVFVFVCVCMYVLLLESFSWIFLDLVSETLGQFDP